MSASEVNLINEKSVAGGEDCHPFCWQADTARVHVHLERRGDVDSGKERARPCVDEVGHIVVDALDKDIA